MKRRGRSLERSVCEEGLRNESAPHCYAGPHLADDLLTDILEPLRISVIDRVEQFETTRTNDIRRIHAERKSSVREEDVLHCVHVDIPARLPNGAFVYADLLTAVNELLLQRYEVIARKEEFPFGRYDPQVFVRELVHDDSAPFRFFCLRCLSLKEKHDFAVLNGEYVAVILDDDVVLARPRRDEDVFFFCVHVCTS
nr:MAG TPA: hypothetical protein [Caudoviricetes sp.]